MLNGWRRPIALVLASSAPVAAGELATGVVVDHQRATVSVMDAQGGIQSLDLSGRPVWSTKEAARPIAAWGGRVLAQAEDRSPGRLRLVILERGRVLRDATLDLPSGAEARIQDLPSSQFRTGAVQTGARVELHWSSERREFQGVVPEHEPARYEGRVRVDLEAATIEADRQPQPQPSAALPAALAVEAAAGAFRERPRRMGALFVATQELRDGDDAPSLVLRRWSAQGTPLPPTSIPDDVTLQLASDDDQQVLLSRRVPGAPYQQSHQWTVVSLDTGSVAAVLAAPVAAARFALVGGRVLYVQPPARYREASGLVASPLRLRVADAQGGGDTWSRPVRDVAFRGRWVP
jgi:hypothetical protein